MDCVFLVSCGKNKKESPARAEDLYVSSRFRIVRKLIESVGSPWFILSAKHGLLPSDKIIESYDQTLKGKPVSEHKAWAEKVAKQMDSLLPPTEAIVILAGKDYYECLMPYLKGRFANVTIPMEGMDDYEHSNWLKKANVKDILPR